jgi:hypothetical protein
VVAAAAPARAELDLVGTWHVLIHYTDDHAQDPEQVRWSDRVWVFERKGDRLTWSEYPIAIFSDETGRFETLPSGQNSRVLGAWEPNEAQRQDIASGLDVNSRGSKKKTLSGSDAEGWTTTSRAQAASASMITYQENWRIESPTGLPVFTQEDVMASARTETLEGGARFATTAVEKGGRVLTGSYERDGTRRGTFRMTRSGKVSFPEGKTQSERQREVLRGLEADDEE